MKTQVFAHKNYIGIKSDPEVEGLINNPMNSGELGFVVDAASVEIQPAALKLLQTLKRSADDIGDVDVFKADDDTVVFAWLGGPTAIIDCNNAKGSSTYDASLLSATNGLETDENFIAYINTL